MPLMLNIMATMKKIGFSSIAAQWKIFCACDIRLKAASCTIDYAMKSSYFFVSINFLKGKKAKRDKKSSNSVCNNSTNI